MKTDDISVESLPVEEEKEGVSRKLDEKLMELQSLFEVSQTLNSSLNLKSILDNMLLTPMGKMMITRGVVLLHETKNCYRIETIKGLPKQVIGEIIQIQPPILEPLYIQKLARQQDDGLDFFIQNNIGLIIPIRSSDRTLGLIGLGNKISQKPYAKAEIDYLRSLSNIAATSIENGLMVMQLQEVNRTLDKKIQELNTLFDIGKELNSTLDTEKILTLLSYAVMGQMIINRCMIFVQDNGKMKLATAKGHRNDEEIQSFYHEQFLVELTKISDAAILDKQQSYDEPLKNLQQVGIRVIVPMRIQNKTKGLLAIGERITKIEFQDYDIEFLSTLGNEAMICLENARLFEETLEKQRMEEELAIAREIQQKLLPQKCTVLERYDISAINVSSRQVSGDYFDCIELSSEIVCLAIADVSGKGTGASLLMANLQATLHALIEANVSLPEIAGKINNLIYRNTTYDKFITFFFGFLNVKENTFTYVNAGHNPPILMREDGSIKLLDVGGLLLGMMPNMPYQQETVSLVPGDWIVMYTDGVTEATNNADEEFEEQRLIATVRMNRDHTAEQMRDKILSEVKEFSEDQPQNDDITMLLLKVKQ
ncbi:SpoIIE family protein phosphatase [candidate division KSB1 bacterium]|nr:SpoIIE family protein phosphatase [candidate division KSB1 bacterium]